MTAYSPFTSQTALSALYLGVYSLISAYFLLMPRFRQEIKPGDLYQLEKEDQTTTVTKRLEKRWFAQKGKHSMSSAVLRTWAWPLFLIMLRLVVVGMPFSLLCATFLVLISIPFSSIAIYGCNTRSEIRLLAQRPHTARLSRLGLHRSHGLCGTMRSTT